MDELSRFYRSRIFEIPSQQRPYSWQKNQIKDFLLDLKISQVRRTHHYCGPIFLENTLQANGQPKQNVIDDPGNQLVHYNILDGQQRVTSIILIATAIANHPMLVAEANNANARAIGLRNELKNLTSYISVGNADHDTPRMNFNNREMDEMLSHLMFQNPPVQPPVTNAGTNRLKENYEYVVEEFNNLCNVNTPADLVSIGNHFLQGMKVILVEMGAHTFNKYTVFESINNRGLTLSEFDKIKNLFLHIAEQHCMRADVAGTIPMVTPAQIQQEWYETIQALYKYDLLENEERCITDLWEVIYNIRKGSENIFSLVKNKFEVLVDQENVGLMAQLLRFYQNWKNYTTSYCKIYTKLAAHKLNPVNMDVTGKENLERMLYQISLPDVFRRPLTCAMMMYTLPEFGELSVFFEKALMRIHGMKTKYHLTAIDGPLTALANSIFGGMSSINCKKRICSMVVEHAPMEQVVKNMFNGNDIYNKGWRGNALYYFLYRIDLYLNLGGHGVPLIFPTEANDRKVQIEHIMPQSHRTNWAASWQNADTADRWLHRLGNLTLTTSQATNNQLGNKTMQDKCIGNYPDHTYAHGRLIEQLLPPIATMFQATHEWQKLEILLNELSYAKYFVKLWSLPCDCDINGEIILDDFSAQVRAEKAIRIENYNGHEEDVFSITPSEYVDFGDVLDCEDHEEE